MYGHEIFCLEYMIYQVTKEEFTANSVYKIVAELLPENPLYLYRMHTVDKATDFFLKNFKGETLYAVKANSDKLILENLFKNGIRKFDVASLDEIIKVNNLLPEAELYFMNPVKSRESIRKGYYQYGVKNFTLDSISELKKITEEIKQPAYIKLYVRFSVPNHHSKHKLSHKFGASKSEAIKLLIECKKYTKDLGLCFHVGTQCMHPDSYRLGINLASEIIKQSNVEVKTLDVGGGFPSIYPGCVPPPLLSYFDTIHNSFNDKKLKCNLICEPGRALVAESGAVITKVQLRKKNTLYINDGIYGNLSDCTGELGYLFPTRAVLLNNNGSNTETMEETPFSFFGPTCDSLDYMQGPFFLPKNIKEGDFIEIGQVGAYGRALSTDFNGLGKKNNNAFTSENSIISMYNE